MTTEKVGEVVSSQSTTKPHNYISGGVVLLGQASLSQCPHFELLEQNR